VSDELDESSLSSESELEVEQPSQYTPGGPAGPTVTLLERLKAPAASDLARKRKIATNPSKTWARARASHSFIA
jgi:hypothetical protein